MCLSLLPLQEQRTDRILQAPLQFILASLDGPVGGIVGVATKSPPRLFRRRSDVVFEEQRGVPFQRLDGQWVVVRRVGWGQQVVKELPAVLVNKAGGVGGIRLLPIVNDLLD